MALLGLLAMAVQLLVIYGLSRQLARPLEQMAKRVSDIENLQFQPATQRVNSHFSEVRKLSRSIETMSQAVQAFSAFVPVDLVRSLMKSGQQLELGGHSRFLTIMFCDLESFSTLSENSPSQELLLRVSKYLEIATRAINEELGTVDKFIGDGVMAFWGAPSALDDHAWHACVAALKIQQRMHELNQGWIAQGLPPLNVRIGIHSDSVLVGNIGSAERMSYTVMGDGVNIAARLEGVNKDFGTQICVSKSVFREAGERLQLRPLEDVTVKGRKAPVQVYELQGLKSAETSAS
jgi:adenylate cyclase